MSPQRASSEDPMPSQSGSDPRMGWDGSPVPERYAHLVETFEFAKQQIEKVAAADRAFGGEGHADRSDPVVRLAEDYMFLVTEMWALGSGVVALATSQQPAYAKHTDAERLRLLGRTGQAILDHLPERPA